MEKLKKNWPVLLLQIAICGCIFILNMATLISPDDYSYARLIGGDDLTINSVAEVWSRCKIFIS